MRRYLRVPEHARGGERHCHHRVEDELLRAVTGGTVTSTTRPLHRGCTLVVLETELTREDGKNAAKVTQALFVS